jgi:hypothetical protein
MTARQAVNVEARTDLRYPTFFPCHQVDVGQRDLIGVGKYGAPDPVEDVVTYDLCI